MSLPESPFRTVIANIVTPAHAERALPCLAELADQAFALAGQQADCDPNHVPSEICTKNRKARIIYSVKDKSRAGPPLPTKVVLYQDSVPAVEIRQVVINLQTEIVEYDGRPSLPMEAGQVERARKEIESYLQESLERLERICDSPGSLEAHCSAWQDFLKCLESNGISSAQSQACTDSPFFEKPCPSCEVLTTLCTSCHAVICLSGDCPASRLIPFQSCSHHTYVATCLSCLQNVQTVPPLGQCPECNHWFCDDELMWCLGRPKETPSNTVCGISSNGREHPPKPIVCSYCELGKAVSGCSNKECWSRERKEVSNPRICQSCSPMGGVSCACERYWICDNCKEPPMADCLKQCPRCKRAYCVSGCEYIGFCAECGRTTLCDDCAEENRSSFAGLPVDGPEVKKVKLLGACQTYRCSKKFCKECRKKRRCANCKQTYCSEWCTRDLECWSCRRLSNVCDNCLEERYCRSCRRSHCTSCMPFLYVCNKCIPFQICGWDSSGNQLIQFVDCQG